MNKAELIDSIAGRLGDKRTANEAVEAVIDTITRTVARGEKVAITGFGIFEKVERAARMARNPATGARVKVKKTSVPKFRAGTQLKAVVSGATKLGPVKSAPAKAAPARGRAASASAAGKKTAGKKAAAKKSTAKKASTARATKKATPAKRVTKATAKKAAPARKAAAKKSPAKAAGRKTATKRAAKRS